MAFLLTRPRPVQWNQRIRFRPETSCVSTQSLTQVAISTARNTVNITIGDHPHSNHGNQAAGGIASQFDLALQPGTPENTNNPSITSEQTNRNKHERQYLNNGIATDLRIGCCGSPRHGARRKATRRSRLGLHVTKRNKHRVLRNNNKQCKSIMQQRKHSRPGDLRRLHTPLHVVKTL